MKALVTGVATMRPPTNTVRNAPASGDIPLNLGLGWIQNTGNKVSSLNRPMNQWTRVKEALNPFDPDRDTSIITSPTHRNRTRRITVQNRQRLLCPAWFTPYKSPWSPPSSTIPHPFRNRHGSNTFHPSNLDHRRVSPASPAHHRQSHLLPSNVQPITNVNPGTSAARRHQPNTVVASVPHSSSARTE